MPEQRWTIHFTGHVQGVGFRYQTCAVAQLHPVQGWVKNLENGSVQVVVEGKARDLDSFLSELREKMGGYIRSVEITKEPASGGIVGFEIRR